MGLKRSVQIPFFRIWYSSAFVIVFLITFLLTLVSPADLIYQAAKDNRSIANIISIAAVYFAAAVLCFFIWASRIYTNRAVLRDIPKQYLPIEAGEVPRKVRRLIERQWERSALVAWDSRPRDVTLELRAEETAIAAATASAAAASVTGVSVEVDDDVVGESARRTERRFRRRERVKGNNTTTVSAKVASKAWGRIAHPGWSIPDAASGQAESVQYTSVIVELPHLLEAKAVSLAPAQATLLQTSNASQEELLATTAASPDPRVVAVLQRSPQLGLRDYLDQLISVGVVTARKDAEDFLQQYEYARFSTSTLTESQFESLMTGFATLLSGMMLDLDRVIPVLDDTDDDDDDDDDDARQSVRSLATQSVVSSLRSSVPRGDNNDTSLNSVDTPDASLQQVSTLASSSTTSSSIRSVIVQSRT